jgi:hypothetical protein
MPLVSDDWIRGVAALFDWIVELFALAQNHIICLRGSTTKGQIIAALIEGENHAD